MLNIFIIDERPMPRLGIKYILQNNIQEIYLNDFNNIPESKLVATAAEPDLIFLGIDEESKKNNPIREVKEIYPGSGIIVYCQNLKATNGIRYLRNGAHGCISSRSTLEILRECIQAVSEHKLYLEPADFDLLLSKVLLVKNTQKKSPSLHSYSLTPRQIEVAALLSQGFSTSGIAQILGLRPSTVSSAKANIYARLKVNNVIRLKEMMDLKK